MKVPLLTKIKNAPSNVRKWLDKWYDSREDREVVDWDQYFLLMAFWASTRSMDAQTQHGCVITDSNHRVLGIGYNSFPPGMPDDILPNLRPTIKGDLGKYAWMNHSERNALANCLVRPDNGIAYITGEPCLPCAMQLYTEGIREFVCADRHGSFLINDEERAAFETMTYFGDVQVTRIKPDFEWLKRIPGTSDLFK